MPTRRFLIASSLARLARKELGGSRVTEGYFPTRPDRSSHVQIEGEKGLLVLSTNVSGASPAEERTEVPQAHAAALMDLVAGKTEYIRSKLPVAGRDIVLDHFGAPGLVDVISVEFQEETESSAFIPLPWFGPEVTADAGYQNRSMALQGFPALPEIPLPSEALDSMLDALECFDESPSPETISSAEAPLIVADSEIPLLPAPTEQPSSEEDRKSTLRAIRSMQVTTAEGPENANLDIEAEVARELTRSLRRRNDRTLARVR
ncbi:hypothetical protein [Microvirga vignae]|uniref:hypothetical protein n=1 Tax=Microvirga vignae TaxID=1225564 RepID=UPI00069B092A|nr:hypothetical protein [Microvirga vignae]